MALPTKPITIVGGGLAGLTLGIMLRRYGVPVILFEAGHYPRHRVCGEFISGRGLAVLEDLGLRSALNAAGACEATKVCFLTAHRASNVYELPQSALCLSRYQLDTCLAEELRKSAATLEENKRWSQTEFGPGVVRATGRRAQVECDGWRWFGIKAHAHGVQLKADLEMHHVPKGYVGLCRLAGGMVNVCGLFWSRHAEPQLAERWRDWLRGQPGSHLSHRLQDAQFDPESFSTVAGLPLAPRSASNLREICVGDALTMIPPVTGNGMSMAFESAALAAVPLFRFSRGEIEWEEARKEIAQHCDSNFKTRLRVAWLLQRCLLLPGWRALLAAAVARSGLLWRELFFLTR